MKNFLKNLKKVLDIDWISSIIIIVNGHHTEKRKGIKTMTYTEINKTEIESKYAVMASFEDGTYNFETLEAVSFDKGYQVTFCQVGDNYSDEEIMWLCSIFAEMSDDGKIYCGVFGNPEISFHFSDRELAIRMAKKFNQISVWDWKAMDEIKTGGTGKR